MKIALITDGIWPYVMGGMQKHSFYLCKYFAQNKVYIDLIHFNQSQLNISKLDVFTDEEKKYINSIIVDFPKLNKLPGHYLKASYLHSKLIFEEIKNNLPSYDFIYTKGFTGWYLIEQKKLGKIKCCKIGVKFHGYEMFQKPPNFKIKLQQIFLLRKPVKKLSLNADVVFSYGGKITTIIKQLGVTENKIIELPSGVEDESTEFAIHVTKKPIQFLYLGRYERRKGIEEINKAINLLDKELTSYAHFNFIGNIPDDKKLKLKHVNYFGEIRDKVILKNLIKQNDVLLCPSYSEGMPNVILEAMANGLTVVATDVGATNVLVNNENGFLLNDSSEQTLIKVIQQIFRTNTLELDIKKQSSLNLIKNNFTWNKLAKDLIVKIQHQINT
ncbi:MAG: glycosyltransferase family 4 protein [Bacteroidetes bacterium]|nr:glycosyltransferase family 4 protein [Bacteroidota bacterium]